MIVIWRNEIVRIVSIKHTKAKIATERGLRWAHISDLVTTPDPTMTPAAAALATSSDAAAQACIASSDDRIPQ